MSSQIDQVKQAIDIVALIGERVKLTRAGKNYKGLCPFHSEKSPSFFVTPELGRYKCFGCQESGDCFTFIQKMDGLSFAQTLQDLAKRAGITLDSVPFTQEDKKRERLLSALSFAREYYHYLLTKHPIGEAARDYLSDRGTTAATVDLFGLGFSPPSWDGVQKYLCGKKGFTIQELIDVGLVIKNDRGRVYDRFRGRLMFPLTTPRGQVVGFSGRLLDKNAKEAKYINSPETSLYHKSELLFGYSQLSSFIRKSEEVILCEGEFDVLSSLQAGVENVVAIKGSALTTSQIKFLSHTVKRLLLALDADSAGIEATRRAIELIKESRSDLSLRVIPLVGGKDPDDIARQEPKHWRTLAKQSVSVYEYLITVAFSRYDETSGDGKRDISRELAPILSQIENAVERAHYVSLVAKRLGVSEAVFLSELVKIKRPSEGQKEDEAVQAPPTVALTRREILERYILSFLFGAIATHHVQTAAWIEQTREHVRFSGIWEKLFQSLYTHRYESDITAFVSALPAELQSQATDLYLQVSGSEQEALTDTEIHTAWQQHAEILSKEGKKQQILRLQELEQKEDLSTAELAEIEAIKRTLS